MMMVVMMVMMTVVPMPPVAWRRTQIHRAQINIDDASHGAKAGLALQAQRLQRDRIAGTAGQQVCADPNSDRRVSADPAEVTGKCSAAQPATRRVDHPCQTGLLSDAKVKTKALNARDIWFRRRSAVAAEDALQLGCRTNDIAHVLAALTFEDTGLDGIILSMGARN
jgi:hypothetical protein